MIDLKNINRRSRLQSQPNPEGAVCVYNVCGKFTLSERNINLLQLSQKMNNVTYNKKRFPALIIRKSPYKSTILLFRTGRGLIIGAQNCKAVENTTRKLAKQLCKILDIKKIRIQQFMITNIMAVYELGFEINIGKLAQDRMSVKNDNMSGVLYRYGSTQQLKKSIIHRSGKVIVCGLKSQKELVWSFKQISKNMLKYKLFQQQSTNTNATTQQDSSSRSF